MEPYSRALPTDSHDNLLATLPTRPHTLPGLSDLSNLQIGGTFKTSLEGIDRVDVSKVGFAAIKHRPLEKIPEEYIHNFTLIDIKQVNLTDLRDKLPLALTAPLGKVKVSYDRATNTISLNAHGADEARVKRGLDYLGICIKLDERGYCEKVIVSRGSMVGNLSRSMLAILLEDCGFAKECASLYGMLKAQLVLPKVTKFLRHQEVMAYEDIDLNKIGKLFESSSFVDAYNEIIKLGFSKSQEVRRFAISYLDGLYRDTHITEDEYIKLREGFFRQDIEEDFRFIERTLRNDADFVRRVFKEVHAVDVTKENISEALIKVTYFARGCNKQTYLVDWEMPNAKRYRFAIATIRDAVMGQGDFSEEEISAAMGQWHNLCLCGSGDIARLGDYVWHNEWRHRIIKTATIRGSEAIQPIFNNILVIGREFVDNATPLNIVLGTDIYPRPERILAMEAAVKAFWRIWFISRDKDNLGTFLRTPRAEDIVVWKDTNGCFSARIIDLDTLSSAVSSKQAFEYFSRYSYYPTELVERIYKELELEYSMAQKRLN